MHNSYRRRNEILYLHQKKTTCIYMIHKNIKIKYAITNYHGTGSTTFIQKCDAKDCIVLSLRYIYITIWYKKYISSAFLGLINKNNLIMLFFFFRNSQIFFARMFLKIIVLTQKICFIKLFLLL